MLNLIWDLDGTLISSENEVLENLYKAIESVGLQKAKMISPFRVGPTIDKMLRLSFEPQYLTEEKLLQTIKAFRVLYDNCDFSNTNAFLGIDFIIKNNLFNHYIITNKPDKPTNRIIQKLGWKPYIKKVLTPYTFDSQKKLSKTELFSKLIQTENLDTRFTFGIGDMQTDCIAAKENNIKTIGVLWGSGTKDELFNCDVVVNNIEELKNFLLSEISA